MFCIHANADDSYGLRRKIKPRQNYDDVRNGLLCYQWAFWTQEFINSHEFNYFNVEWSSYVEETPKGYDFFHSWISVYACDNDPEVIIHLDPWADYRVIAYSTEEHGQELPVYGVRNFVGFTGLPQGAVSGYFYKNDGSRVLIDMVLWKDW